MKFIVIVVMLVTPQDKPFYLSTVFDSLKVLSIPVDSKAQCERLATALNGDRMIAECINTTRVQ